MQKNTEKKTAKNVIKNSKNNVAKKTVSRNSMKEKAITQKKASVQKGKVQKKSTKKATNTKRITSTTKPKKAEIIEYYDLPYRYNQTVVKILAQTPNTLFVYWDISNSDRENYINKYGNDFFTSTVPVLIVHNKTMNYSFEIEINDFANSWYFTVDDAKCNYEIELGRRAKSSKVELPDNYVYVTSSNIIEAPNNHILFEKNQKTVFFRNVKTNNTVSKDISEFNFMKYAGRVYNIYDIYRKIYRNEELNNIVNNPSSRV